METVDTSIRLIESFRKIIEKKCLFCFSIGIDAGEYKMNPIYNNLFRGQVKFSNSGLLHNSSRTSVNLASKS